MISPSQGPDEVLGQYRACQLQPGKKYQAMTGAMCVLRLVQINPIRVLFAVL